MIKSQEVTRDLKTFNSLFNDLCYKHDGARIFDDLLTIIICCFAYGTQEPLYLETVKNYERKELDTFAKIMGELLLIYHKAEQAGTWTDPLGEYYELLAGRYKKAGLGQFFTPKALCDLMAQITMQNSHWSTTVNDPCSGSGRLILASNEITKDITYHAQDLDPICCKMTAINMGMHKIKGKVMLTDTLANTPPRKIYHVNPKWQQLKTPHFIIN